MTQAHIETLLKETMGLNPGSIGSSAIEVAIHSRMTSLGLDQIGEYWNRVCASEDELQELIEIVVVPETWFFRDEEAFVALARLVSKEWLLAHPFGRLRLLSGPCCSGEEPYSMAMALLDAGVARECLHVDAVDISKRALRRAHTGLYGANSFRSTNLEFRARYFQRTNNGYCLSTRVRELVNFQHGNLMMDNFRAGVAPYDVIFCRNVLIYFDGATQKRVLNRLSSLLGPGGLLFVGPAEAFLAASNGFRTINESMSFAFRKANTSLAESPSVAFPTTSKAKNVSPTPRAARPASADVAVVSTRNYSSLKISPDSSPDATPGATPDSIPVTLERIRKIADAGRLTEAVDLCETYLKKKGASVEALCLLGLLKDAGGDTQRAAECYRKVLYLEPGHTEALTHLALLMERQGDIAAATRLRERVRRNEMAAAR